MKPEDKSRFESIMHGLAANFNVNISKDDLRIRFDCLHDIDIEQFQKAAYQIIRTRVYTSLPTVKDFLDAIYGKPEQVAEVEAYRVVDAVRKYGSYGTVVFDNSVTMWAIERRGGWIKLCEELSDKDLNWFVKDFVKSYQAFSNSAPKKLTPLLGRVASNPVFIGDKDKCQKIIADYEHDKIKRIEMNGTV
jgi:hypothetical protein